MEEITNQQAIESEMWKLDIGANIAPNGKTTFRVWAPYHHSLKVEIIGQGTYRMEAHPHGYFVLNDVDVDPGSSYFYCFENGHKRPDPVSRALPDCLHGPTQVVNPETFVWRDQEWKGISLRECIIYEIHVGAYTPKGTFEAIIDKIPYLKDLGVNCLEIMPVAQFSGRWNWGYDGASLYSPASIYGGVDGFKQLVDICHHEGIAICLDLVYNHLGPEGNYLQEFAPYFSDIYSTPWGRGFNFDGEWSDHVRGYVIKNALHWILEYHVDILRLDAIHGIYDNSATLMLPELVDAVSLASEAIGRPIPIIAESGNNDSNVVRSKAVGGWEFGGVWNDDYEHTAHVALTGEQTTYYQDFNGLGDLAKALRGFVYQGQFSAFRKRRHGNSMEGVALDKLIVFLQNHDQCGNRPMGDRLTTLVTKERLKVAAILCLITPSVPMLFMGEEYGEKAPFEYFVDYHNERLMRTIYEGRKHEFHRSDMPYPGQESFENSRLTWEQDSELLELHKRLIQLRKANLPVSGIMPEEVHVYYIPEDEWVAWEYKTENGDWFGAMIYLNRYPEPLTFELPFQHVNHVVLSTQSIEYKEDNSIHLPADTAVLFSSINPS